MCALAFLSWGSLLFNTDGIYWDDWWLQAQPAEHVAKVMISIGGVSTSIFHLTLLSLGNGIFSYRVACFAAACTIALAIFGILVRSRLFGRIDALLIAALALVFPVNQARIAAINVPSQIAFALFMCAWYLSLRNFEKPAFWKRGLALVFFFISFSTQSLLLFYVLPITHLFWVQARKMSVLVPKTIWQNGLGWIRSNIDLLLVPFVFYLVKTVLYSPPSIYENYNAITIEGLYTGVWKAVGALLPAFVDPIVSSSPNPVVAVLFGGFALVLLLSGYFKSRPSDSTRKRSFLLIAGGLVSFLIAVYPYCVVDKIPSSEEWQSRHQLLVPFGAAILLFGLIEVSSVGKRYLVLVATAYFIVTFAWADLRMLHDYRVDWQKQLAIIEGLKALKPARDARGGVFLFVDNAADLNASNRFFRFYELSAFLRRAYGDQTRFGALLNQCESRNRYHQFKGEGYNVDDYEGGAVAGVIRIDRNKGAESFFDESVGAVLKIFGKYPAPSGKPGSDLVRLHFIPPDAAEIPADCR